MRPPLPGRCGDAGRFLEHAASRRPGCRFCHRLEGGSSSCLPSAQVRFSHCADGRGPEGPGSRRRGSRCHGSATRLRVAAGSGDVARCWRCQGGSLGPAGARGRLCWSLAARYLGPPSLGLCGDRLLAQRPGCPRGQRLQLAGPCGDREHGLFLGSCGSPPGHAGSSRRTAGLCCGWWSELVRGGHAALQEPPPSRDAEPDCPVPHLLRKSRWLRARGGRRPLPAALSLRLRWLRAALACAALGLGGDPELHTEAAVLSGPARAGARHPNGLC
mmetsp:Transcript_73446/g.175107  ORF Transcript_73446/g.175107 Transcript_73446/m.175107 type:complete len:273 (-) Transcript_73446:4206-5024(-)